jgi:hypothetical protein
MDFGAFLKTALYRVIFVLIVGIPAVEVFSFLLFDKGILIQKVEDKNPPFEGSAKLSFDQITFSNKNASLINASLVSQKTLYQYPLEFNLKKVEFTFSQNRSIIVLTNPDIFSFPIKRNSTDKQKSKSFIFTLRDLSTTGWILYLGLAWVLGELLCF